MEPLFPEFNVNESCLKPRLPTGPVNKGGYVAPRRAAAGRSPAGGW